MNDTKIDTIDQLKKVLDSTESLSLKIYRKDECHVWIQTILVRFKYRTLKKKQRSVVRRYIRKMTGYSKSQMDTLIARYIDRVPLQKQYTRNTFLTKFTREDIILLAKTDIAHHRLSGEATQSILKRQYTVFDITAYENISKISVAHIYNLRKAVTYTNTIGVTFEKTRSVLNEIGSRQKPCPNGCPGFIRVDTVHQGDLEGQKGVYHINTVDEVTQWEIVGCVESIGWKHMKPLFDSLLAQYPFEIRGFHADNGSEYINKEVARMLNQLLVQFTKSRARRSNDNALVECKNGWVVRKHMGHVHIPRENAPMIHAFYRERFNPYLNYHRPCGFATCSTDSKGKIRKKYEVYMTPYEKFISLPNAPSYLKSGVTLNDLRTSALAIDDNTAATEMNQAKKKLFKNFIYPFR
jgi:hypothetical protein